MDDYLGRGKAGRRGVGFIAVLAFHGLLIWGLMNGLAQKIVDVVQEIDVAKIEEAEPPPPEELPPPPPPPPKEPPPFVPPPDFEITATTSSESAITQTTTEVTPTGPTRGVRLDPRRPPSKPDYPPSAKRLEQEGSVGLLLLVGPDGRVIEARLDRTSGYPALDAAAVKEAKNWRFLPAEENGKPVQAWYRTSVRFRLEDA